MRDRMIAALFNEELGAVIQVLRDDRPTVMQALRDAGLGACAHMIGTLNKRDEIRVWRNAKLVFGATRIELQRAWSEVSYQIARLRDDAGLRAGGIRCAARCRRSRPVGGAELSIPPRPSSSTGARPRMAILREQGVNGQVEMAAAFDRAGFASVDVHMSDLQAGRVSLADFKGLAACGGFSYGDVLGAGQGWAKSILFNDRLRDEFAAFFDRADTFALGVCNGCQMMSNLAAIIPGAQDWPTFHRNRSEQFEARFVMVEIPPVAVDLLRRHGRLAPAGGRSARRRPRGLRRFTRSRPWWRCATSTTAARRPRPIRSTPTARPTASPA